VKKKEERGKTEDEQKKQVVRRGEKLSDTGRFTSAL
jgi:hypothetical protein